jgi:queuine/archaeosine tRNA-ribosyltransferase
MINIDPMTRVKDIKIEQQIAKYSCPFCSCSFTEHDLIVEMKSHFKFNLEGDMFELQKEMDKVICSNCKNDITMAFIDVLYERYNNIRALPKS